MQPQLLPARHRGGCGSLPPSLPPVCPTLDIPAWQLLGWDTAWSEEATGRVWGHRAAGITLFGGSLLEDLRLTSHLCDIPHASLQKSLTLHLLFHVDFLWDQQNSSCGWFKVFLKPRITLKGDSVLGWKSLSPAERSFCRKRLVSLMGKKTTGSPGGATGFAYEKTAEKSP